MAKRARKQGKVTQGRGWSFVPAIHGAAAAGGRARSAPAELQKIDVREERRNDKQVTVARGFSLTDADLEALAKRLKVACGAGGTAKDDAIEVQGRHRAKVVELLAAAGYRIK